MYNILIFMILATTVMADIPATTIIRDKHGSTYITEIPCDAVISIKPRGGSDRPFEEIVVYYKNNNSFIFRDTALAISPLIFEVSKNNFDSLAILIKPNLIAGENLMKSGLSKIWPYFEVQFVYGDKTLIEGFAGKKVVSSFCKEIRNMIKNDIYNDSIRTWNRDILSSYIYRLRN